MERVPEFFRHGKPLIAVLLVLREQKPFLVTLVLELIQRVADLQRGESHQGCNIFGFKQEGPQRLSNFMVVIPSSTDLDFELRNLITARDRSHSIPQFAEMIS